MFAFSWASLVYGGSGRGKVEASAVVAIGSDIFLFFLAIFREARVGNIITNVCSWRLLVLGSDGMGRRNGWIECTHGGCFVDGVRIWGQYNCVDREWWFLRSFHEFHAL